jgi:hypothetical protein
VIRRIYHHFGFDFSAEFEERIKKHLAEPRQTGHGRHKYDPEGFGVAELRLGEKFPDYRARFGDLLSDA